MGLAVVLAVALGGALAGASAGAGAGAVAADAAVNAAVTSALPAIVAAAEAELSAVVSAEASALTTVAVRRVRMAAPPRSPSAAEAKMPGAVSLFVAAAFGSQPAETPVCRDSVEDWAAQAAQAAECRGVQESTAGTRQTMTTMFGDSVIARCLSCRHVLLSLARW